MVDDRKLWAVKERQDGVTSDRLAAKRDLRVTMLDLCAQTTIVVMGCGHQDSRPCRQKMSAVQGMDELLASERRTACVLRVGARFHSVLRLCAEAGSCLLIS